MAKIQAKESRTFRVPSPMNEVYGFFRDPTNRSKVMTDLERHEVIDDDTVRYVLVEKREKGVKFRGDFTIKYSGNESDRVEWQTQKGSNIDIAGSAKLRAVNASTTEVTFQETLAPDLPIPRLAAKIFRPIVAREVRAGIQTMLDNVERTLTT